MPVGHPEFGKLQICICRETQLTAKTRSRLFTLSNLDELKHLTFDTFQPRGHFGVGASQADSIERAYNLARQFSQSLEGWLLFQGRYGCGKTHLSAAISNFAVSLGIPALFITVPDLLDTLRHSYNATDYTFEERFNEIRQVRLLILDDFGTQNATGWAQEKLFQILNYRYINRLPTVITTNVTLDEIEHRIRSRLHDPDLVTKHEIQAPDYRRPLDDTGHHELSSLSYLAKHTFGTFDLRKREKMETPALKSLEKAFRAAQAYSERPEGWLVFMGDYGCGKTHLAAAIANHRAGMGLPPLFIMVPDLFDHLRATFAPDSLTRYDRRFEEIRAAPLLVLDDLGTQAMTPWVREKLYQLFNHRYNAELPTVITTANRLEEIDPRIRSRLTDTRLCTMHFISAPAYSNLTTATPPPKRSRRKR